MKPWIYIYIFIFSICPESFMQKSINILFLSSLLHLITISLSSKVFLSFAAIISKLYFSCNSDKIYKIWESVTSFQLLKSTHWYDFLNLIVYFFLLKIFIHLHLSDKRLVLWLYNSCFCCTYNSKSVINMFFINHRYWNSLTTHNT